MRGRAPTGCARCGAENEVRGLRVRRAVLRDMRHIELVRERDARPKEGENWLLPSETSDARRIALSAGRKAAVLQENGTGNLQRDKVVARRCNYRISGRHERGGDGGVNAAFSFCRTMLVMRSSEIVFHSGVCQKFDWGFSLTTFR